MQPINIESVNKRGSDAVLLLLFPVLMGAGLAMQTAVNSKLQRFTHSAYLASGVSFLIAWLFLLLLSIGTHQSLTIPVSVLIHNPLWLWLGGLFGAIALTGNVILFQKIGSLQTTVLPIMGQIMMSVLIDQFGLFKSPNNPIMVSKIFGLVLIVAGVVMSLGVLDTWQGKIEQEAMSAEKRSSTIWYQLFAVAAGAMMAMQTAINGTLGVVLKSPIHAAFVSFSIGVFLLLLVNIVISTHFSDVRLAVQQGKHYWWIWIGGIIGALYILGSSWLVPLIGTGQVVILALFGQLSFSALIEHFGLLESVSVRVTRSKAIGLTVMFIGVLVVKFVKF